MKAGEHGAAVREEKHITADPLALSRFTPELSAVTPVTGCQKLVLFAAVIAALAAFGYYPRGAALGFIAFSTLFYIVFSVYKLVLVRFSVKSGAQIEVKDEELKRLDENSLPVYSILVPLFRESESVGNVVEAIEALDYPAAKKDVQLLLEEDDGATRSAVGNFALPEGFRITVIPRSFPRTKPKACNIGLAEARGKYLVIYDAEDRPENDQLKKAVAAFSRVDRRVVCLQSRLNFYNPRQNLFTRWFAAEYSAWFDFSLPGLSAVNSVIPLGGTSNHFITSALRKMMGWDAYNVTEDCDLGIRIYRRGYRSKMLNTTTWEEACSKGGLWIRQRTRWLKGYIQTYLVHMRRPGRLLGDLGWKNFLHFQALIGGIVFSFLINPVFWFMALLWFFLRLEALTALFPGPVFAGGAVCLFAGNFVFVYICACACYKRKLYDLIKYAVLTPVYWVLMSYSGWRALIHFAIKPFTWEKTRHGLFHEK
ncbi:MAG: glycosyltransferase [Kiritimatiellia bacterium]